MSPTTVVSRGTRPLPGNGEYMRKTTILAVAILAGLTFGAVWNATAEAG